MYVLDSLHTQERPKKVLNSPMTDHEALSRQKVTIKAELTIAYLRFKGITQHAHRAL